MLLAVAGWRTHPSNFYEEKLSFNINEYFPWESLWPMTVQRFPIMPHRDFVRGWNTIAKSQDTHGFGKIFLKR